MSAQIKIRIMRADQARSERDIGAFPATLGLWGRLAAMAKNTMITPCFTMQVTLGEIFTGMVITGTNNYTHISNYYSLLNYLSKGKVQKKKA